MFEVAVRLPVAWGVNVTEIVHFFLLATLLPQVLVWAKSPGFVPVNVMLVILRAIGRLLVRVKVFAALVVSMACEANVIVAGVSVACATPVPDSATVCGLSAALSVKVSDPVSAPSTVGENVTLTVHFAPAASVPGQVFAEIAK